MLVHFDRNGFGYTIDRTTGIPLVAQKYDPAVNWSTGVDLDPKSPTYGRPAVVAKYSTFLNGADVNTKGIVPAALGTKDQQPAAYSPLTKLFYVPTNHVAMDYEPFKVSYTPGQPYVGATLSMFPPEGDTNLGNFIAWDHTTGKIVWSNKEPFSVWSGALTTAGGLVFYGTLEGYIKAVDQKDGKELFKFKTPVRHHRQRLHLQPQGQAARRRLFGHRRLGRHRPCGRARQADRRPRRRRRLRRPEAVHRPRRVTDRVLAALALPPKVRPCEQPRPAESTHSAGPFLQLTDLCSSGDDGVVLLLV